MVMRWLNAGQEIAVLFMKEYLIEILLLNGI